MSAKGFSRINSHPWVVLRLERDKHLEFQVHNVIPVFRLIIHYGKPALSLCQLSNVVIPLTNNRRLLATPPLASSIYRITQTRSLTSTLNVARRQMLQVVALRSVPMLPVPP